MKIKYSFFLTSLLLFFFSIEKSTSAMYFTTDYFANIAFSPKGLGKPTAGVYGLFKHSLNGEKTTFNLDVQVGNTDNAYNIAKINILFLLINPYIKITNSVNTFSIGFIPLMGSETYINESQSKSPSFLGVQLINSIIKPTIDGDTFYIVNSPFLHSDYSLGISYVGSLLYDTLQLGASYSPNYNLKLSVRDFSPSFLNNQTFDLSAVYYNEYNSIGYGLNASFRYLMPLNSAKVSKLENTFNTKINHTYELSLGLDIDYMGFSHRLGYAQGSNYIKGENNTAPNKLSYYVTKTSLSYSIDKYKLGASYTYSKVLNSNKTYKTKLLEVEAVYNASRYLGLKTSVYKEWLNNKAVEGILFAISVSI